MKSNYLLIYFLLFSVFGFSQNYGISGKVSDASGMPMPGVSIQIQNTTTGTTSDLDGNFTLASVPAGSTVQFSFIGYVSYAYKVNANASGLSIKLTEDTKSLDEVVVIGYGSQKKREVSGAISTVSSRTLEILKPVKIEQALQGTVAGVNVTTQSGAPGAALDIRIRGIATNGDNSPLVIVDGYISELGLINPNDVETMTILKDSQAAIYGASGANGVILITLKKGKKNSKASINYNVYTGFQETSRKLPTLNATDYALLLNESYANGGQPIPYPNVSGLGQGTNWQDKVFGKSVPITSHDITAMGGSDKITYSIGGSTLDQSGIVGEKKSNFQRNTGRLNLNAELRDNLKLETGIVYTQFDRRSISENALGSVLFNALNVPATLSPYDADGAYTLVPSTTGFGTEIINPLAQLANTFNAYNYKKLAGNFGLEYEVIKGLKVTGRVGFNTSNSKSRDFSKQVDYGGKVFDVTRSSVSQGRVNDNSYTFDLFATYDKNITDDHHIQVTAGTTAIKEWGDALFATGFDVPNNSWEFADISLTPGLSESKSNSAYGYDERKLSQFGRIMYDFKKRYFVSFLGRRDLSTKFGPENRVAYFPSFTAGWIASDESFFPKGNIISFFKIRGSYGSIGNDKIGNNGYLSLLNGEATYVIDNQLVNGTATGQIPNSSIRWEKSQKLNVGFDAKMFNDKVNIVSDYFVDQRKDLLIQNIPVSGIFGTGAPGASAPTLNAGSVKNYGLEFSIGYTDKIADAVEFNMNYNVTFIKNKVTAVNNGTGFLSGGTFGLSEQPSRMEVGMPIGYFYGYKTDGIFQNAAEVAAHPSQLALGAEAEPGDLRFVDVNKDGVINTADKTYIGDPIPAATMGFNLTLAYKGFDFAAYSYASIGNDMVRNYERNVPNGNRLNYVLDRWTGEGTSNSVPRVTTAATSNTVFSDYYVEDASFLRISNMQLGYTIPAAYTEKAGVTKARLYVSVNNLYTFTKYRGYDPGASNGAPIGGGVDQGFYPVPRTYMLGANINF